MLMYLVCVFLCFLTMGKLEQSVQSFKDSASSYHVVAFSTLQPRSKSLRCEAAKQVLEVVAGENPEELLNDLHYQPDILGGIRKAINKLEGDASVASHHLKISILQFVVGFYSWPHLKSLGFRMGEALYNTAASLRRQGTFIYDRVCSGGRPAADTQAIVDGWLSLSVPLPSGARQIIGGVMRAAENIGEQVGCATHTAYAHRPTCIKQGRKAKDLCIYCESLLQVRKQVTSLLPGGDVDVAGQRGFKTLKFAIQDFLSSSAEHEDVYERLQKLEEHEALAERLKEAFDAHLSAASTPNNNTLLVVADFRSNFLVTNWRGDSFEYFNGVSKVGCCGLHFWYQGRTMFVDLLSFDTSHTGEAAGYYVRRGVAKALDVWGLRIRREELNLVLWSDCARHFRNGNLVFSLLLDPASDAFYMADASLNFFAENHGKSIVDAHFSVLGKVSESAVVHWRPETSCDQLVDVFQRHAQQNNKNWQFERVAKPEFERVEMRSAFRDISIVHHISKTSKVGCLKVHDREIEVAAVEVAPRGKKKTTHVAPPGIQKCVQVLESKFDKLKLWEGE